MVALQRHLATATCVPFQRPERQHSQSRMHHGACGSTPYWERREEQRSCTLCCRAEADQPLGNVQGADANSPVTTGEEQPPAVPRDDDVRAALDALLSV